MSNKKIMRRQYKLVYYDALFLGALSVIKVKNMRGRLISPDSRKGVKQAIKKFLKERP